MNTLLTAILIAVLAIAGQSQYSTVDEKVQGMTDLLARSPVVRFNIDRWKNFVRTQPRNYSVVVMFTALSPNVNCPICRPAYDEFVIVANSHRFGSSESDKKKVFFGIVDYEESPQIFQQMNLNTAPILYHFGAKLGPKKKPDQMDFQRQGFDADTISKWTADKTDVQIRVIRPPNYTAPVVAIFLVGLILGILYLKRNSLDFLFNRNTWGFVCLAITFIFMSGQMWNHIRGPPFMITNPQTKEPNFIHHSTQFQLVAETYMVAVLYGLVAFGFIIVNEAADMSSNDKNKKKNNSNSFFNLHPNTIAIVGLVFICVFFSFLLSIFRSKYRGYPYSFLFS